MSNPNHNLRTALALATIDGVPMYGTMLLSRDGDEDGRWVTVNSQHIFIKGGRITKGPAALVGKPAKIHPVSSSQHGGHAPAGGVVHESNGQEYKGGQRLPTHGHDARPPHPLFSGKAEPATSQNRLFGSDAGSQAAARAAGKVDSKTSLFGTPLPVGKHEGLFGENALRPAEKPAEEAAHDDGKVKAHPNALDPRHTAEMFPAKSEPTPAVHELAPDADAHHVIANVKPGDTLRVQGRTGGTVKSVTHRTVSEPIGSDTDAGDTREYGVKHTTTATVTTAGNEKPHTFRTERREMHAEPKGTAPAPSLGNLPSEKPSREQISAAIARHRANGKDTAQAVAAAHRELGIGNQPALKAEKVAPARAVAPTIAPTEPPATPKRSAAAEQAARVVAKQKAEGTPTTFAEAGKKWGEAIQQKVEENRKATTALPPHADAPKATEPPATPSDAGKAAAERASGVVRPEAYVNGDRGEYTGTSEQLHGGTFYHVEMTEGKDKGKVKVTSRPPGATSSTVQDANAESARQGQENMNEGMRRLRDDPEWQKLQGLKPTTSQDAGAQAATRAARLHAQADKQRKLAERSATPEYHHHVADAIDAQAKAVGSPRDFNRERLAAEANHPTPDPTTHNPAAEGDWPDIDPHQHAKDKATARALRRNGDKESIRQAAELEKNAGRISKPTVSAAPAKAATPSEASKLNQAAAEHKPSTGSRGGIDFDREFGSSPAKREADRADIAGQLRKGTTPTPSDEGSKAAARAAGKGIQSPMTPPPGVYATTTDMERDYEPMGHVGQAAIAYSGMSHKYDQTHHMNVSDMLAHFTKDKQAEYMTTPGGRRNMDAYHDLRAASASITEASRQDPAFAKSVEKIRGPLAAKFVEMMAPGGELQKFPHLQGQRAKEFAEYAKPYPKAKPATSSTTAAGLNRTAPMHRSTFPVSGPAGKAVVQSSGGHFITKTDAGETIHVGTYESALAAAKEHVTRKVAPAATVAAPQAPTDAGKAAATAAASPKAPPTPREKAAKVTASMMKGEYAFARESSIGNAGEDLANSARHKRNAWKGLDEAEKNGTAAQMVTREKLLENEPHNLMAHAEKNPQTALAMHHALRAFPAQPAYGKAYERTKPEDKAKHRQQFVEAYRGYKAKAEELAASEPNAAAAVQKLQHHVREQLRVLRGQKTNDSIGRATAADAYNAVANGLVGTANNLTMGNGSKNFVGSKVAEFSKAMRAKYGQGNEANAPGHIRDVMNGVPLHKTFGTESPAAGKGSVFNPADLYVGTPERKGGRDLSHVTGNANQATKHLTDTFKMRGVQWGNSVTDDERAHHAKHIVGALTDLAEVTGLKPEDISLNGKLGLAIGARGHGGASAHYEPGNKVINLTRENGVGTVAHEWGHGFDHDIAGGGLLSNGEKMVADFQSGHTHSQRMVKAAPGEPTTYGGYKVDEKGKPVLEDLSKDPIHAAMEGIRQSMQSSGYNKRLAETTSKIERTPGMKLFKGREYWHSHEEKFARSFEKHVQHKLHEAGRENTYLSGLPGEHQEPMHETYAALWPNKEEAAHMAPHFDKLFEAYRNKKYGTPDVQHFSRSAGEAAIYRLLSRSVA